METSGRRARKIREAILGYLMVLPAGIITVMFGLWPVAYGFYISLNRQRLGQDPRFLGLENYVTALGGVAYVLGLALVVIFSGLAIRYWRKARQALGEHGGNLYLFMLPGFALMLGAVLMIVHLLRQDLGLGGFALIALVVGGASAAAIWQFRPHTHNGEHLFRALQIGLLVWLAVGMFYLIMGQMLSSLSIVTEMAEAITRRVAGPASLLNQIIAVAIALAAGAVAWRLWKARRRASEREQHNLHKAFTLGLIAVGVVFVLSTLTVVTSLNAYADLIPILNDMDEEDYDEFVLEDARYEEADLDQDEFIEMLVIWPQTVLIGAGVLLVGLAYLAWQRANRAEGKLRTAGIIAIALCMMLGGWMLITAVPQALASGDTDYQYSLLVTATYSLGTIPFQLGLGLFLAYLLFYGITRGMSFYRMIFFLPYIAPTVATATVFTTIFSVRPTSLANQFVNVFGMQPLEWTKESNGIYQILAENILGTDVQLQPFLQGPSLAIVSIIIFNIWVFSGYNAVIFMAGLGSIPSALYEAAEVDGASRWQVFRHVTLPMLSPTTFFLTMLSIIGTFKAFSHIYVLRDFEARGAADTASIYIFDSFYNGGKFGYASALAFVLFGVIMILTLVQNRLSGERIHYG
jgi:multiple sugar transport system permease protein